MALKDELDIQFVDHDYLSDGAYIGYTNYRTIVIFTSDGMTMHNRIELDDTALKALDRFNKRMKEKYKL